MGEDTSFPGASDGLSQDDESMEAAREARLIEAVVRAQERRREGGIEPEPDEPDEEPASGE